MINLDNLNYEDYHKHTFDSNIYSADSATHIEDYAKRCVELGQKTLSTVEHGYCGRFLFDYNIAKKYNLKLVIGAEAYWVKDRFENDKTNNHIIILAKNENGRQWINEVLAQANETGLFNGRPRLDWSLIELLPSNDVFITSACVGFNRYGEEYSEEMIYKLKNKFGENFMLEVQYHHTEKQKDYNKFLLQMHKKYNIELIMGCDSHIIDESQAIDRDDLLLSKGVSYSDEDSWFMDYPSVDICVDRFLKQGVLSEDQIETAIRNTNIVSTFEDFFFSKDEKMPTIYPNKTQEEKNNIYKKLISDGWNDFKYTLSPEKYREYMDEIKKEVSVVCAIDKADYFILNHAIIQKGIKNGGIITPTARGCFTEEALVHTDETIKPIKDIKIGDKVITSKGNFNKVTNTMIYEIDEELVKISHLYGTDTHSPTICTKDHKILIKRCDKNIWVEAQYINEKTDHVCVPKINIADSGIRVIDLSNYNHSQLPYDDEFIYEVSIKPFLYSPSDVARNIKVGARCIEKFADIEKYPDYKMFEKKIKHKLSEFFEYTGFETREDYARYVKENRTKKINRFMSIDRTFNEFIGLMYGDGFTCKNKNDVTRIGLAINSQTEKDKYNKRVFYDIASRLGIDVYENHSKTKNLTQLYINSRTFSTFVKEELFESKKDKLKIFNKKWFNQSEDNLRGIIKGLVQSDGHIEIKANRISFDNTSPSLINAYKLLSLMTGGGVNRIDIRNKYKTKDGYECKKSYKMTRRIVNNSNCKIKDRLTEDEHFYYLPVKKIEILEKRKTKVYDITVENEHNYLLNNMIVHNSASSYLTNTLLGFSTMDRIESDVKLYPERFMAIERAGTPDIDFNLGTVEIFEEAQKEVMGENHSYPMISYGTLKPKSALKMYARSQKLDTEIAQEISNQISKYDHDYNKAEDEDKDDIDLLDYIDEKYHPYIEASEKYLGIIVDKKKAPCSYILYSGDIRREIGLIRIKSKTTGKDVICANIEGSIAEEFGYIKNDLLKVDIHLLVQKICDRAKIKKPSAKELLKIIKNDVATWEIYSKGLTCLVNQVDSEGTKAKVMKYKPRNYSELSAFLAGIRPGFKSHYSQFEKREPFSYGIPALDNLLQTESFPYSYMLYQEQTMAVLNYAGISMGEGYTVIKAISKKKIDKIRSFKDAFIEGFTKRLKEEDSTLTDERINAIVEESWTIVIDSGRYSFNASHSLAYAIDSAYCAWLKANYPYEFYEVALQMYSTKGKKDKVNQLIKEMREGFNIRSGSFSFGLDNRSFNMDKDNNIIYPSILSIKHMNDKVAKELYSIKDIEFETFSHLLVHLLENTILTKTHIEILIKINYFKNYGKAKKLYQLYDYFQKRYKKTHIEKTKEKRLLEVIEYGDGLEDKGYTMKEQFINEIDKLGYPITTIDKAPSNLYVVSEYDDKYAIRIRCYNIKSGETTKFTMYKNDWKINPIGLGSIIQFNNYMIKKDGSFRLKDYKYI